MWLDYIWTLAAVAVGALIGYEQGAKHTAEALDDAVAEIAGELLRELEELEERERTGERLTLRKEWIGGAVWAIGKVKDHNG